ncbi:hypothetical protein [Enhygromyxa salina]|uniref:Uncharacterized protein n=1 Tax=Enhygromyxa salina TaxID=215803 RepID=A0A2S9YN66_9BACT|nr:hypothetical protein [Enhygromyxa salina]PRQ06534.1 hypothetical protein ENSA7_38540 [Enhygromyxa salina]
MTKKHKYFGFALLSLALLANATACRAPLPCPDCDEQDGPEDEQEDGPVPDLPCGGADLMTDNLNCGTCGNECTVFFEGLEWEAGSCQAGECGPIWVECMQEGFGATCEELCKLHEASCVPNGCAGSTALLMAKLYGCDPDDEPIKTMVGACDEPIPWSDEDVTHARCCCGW